MKLYLRVLLFIYLSCCLVLSGSAKPAGKKNALEVPAYGEIDTSLLKKASCAALVSAIEYFKAKSAEDDEGWIAPPRRQRKVVDSETYTLHYREEETEIPVYKYKYDNETYEVLVPRKHGQSVDAVVTYEKVKRTRRRVVSREQVGTKTITHLVRDDSGPIARDHTRPIYGPGGPDVWAVNALGDNALVLYAVRKAGLPTDDELVRTLAENLCVLMWRYGLPDSTWDLAWTTAAFATLPKDNYQDQQEQLVSKLLDGQIREGAGRGLWGPVCINVPLMMELIPKARNAGLAFLEAKKVSKAKGDGDSMQKETEAEKNYMAMKDAMRRVAVAAMAGPNVELRVPVSSEEGDAAYMPGLADYIYNQTSADLESTALVLFALREASSKGLLPEKVWRPEGTRMSAENPAKILARTAYALAGAQRQDGSWDEMNRHQPFKSSNIGVEFPGLPPKMTAYPKLPSEATLLTQTEGFLALVSTGHIVGFDKLLGRYGRNVLAGMRGYQKAAEVLLSRIQEGTEVSGCVPPYDCILFLSDIARSIGGLAARQDLRVRLAYALLATRKKEGNWALRTDSVTAAYRRMPSSLRARAKVIKPEDLKEAMKKIDYAEPHVGITCARLENLVRAKRRGGGQIETVVPTAMAMLFLADGLRPPVAAEYLWSKETRPSAMLPMITMVMSKNHGSEFHHAMLSRPITYDALAKMPGVFIRGSGSFDPSDEEKKAMGDYLAKGGLVIVEMEANAQGLPFFKESQAVLKEVLPGSEVGNIGADKNLLGNMAGRASVQALKNSDGSLSALFLPITTAGGRGGLAAHIAAEIAYNTLLQKIAPEVLEEDYAIANAGELSAEDLIQQLLSGLPPEPEEPPAEEAPAADEKAVDQPPAEAVKKKPAEDEVW